MLDYTGGSHAAVRKQDVRGLGHFVTIQDQGAASTPDKALPSGFSLLRALGFDKSSSVHKDPWRQPLADA